MYFLKNVPDVDHNKHVLNFVGLYLRSIESYRDSNTTIRILVLKSRYISIFIRLRNKQRLLWALSELHVRCYALVIPSAIFGLTNPWDTFSVWT